LCERISLQPFVSRWITACVKILAGREMGFPPIASMVGISIIEGKPAAGANLLAAAMKRAGYTWRVCAAPRASEKNPDCAINVPSCCNSLKWLGSSRGVTLEACELFPDGFVGMTAAVVSSPAAAVPLLFFIFPFL
jgi:hypothetical protein